MLDHVGIVVADLAQARSFVEEVLGLECTDAEAFPDRGLEVAFFALGNAKLELIEVTDPEARRKRLGDNVARIEHIAIKVDDVESTVERLRGFGVKTTTEAAVFGVGALSYWTQAETSGGVGYQFLERPPS